VSIKQLEKTNYYLKNILYVYKQMKKLPRTLSYLITIVNSKILEMDSVHLLTGVDPGNSSFML